MSIIYRADKGSPLTADEVDENFRGLDDRVTEVEENPPEAVSIDTIEVTGNQMVITLTNSVVQGPFDLDTADWEFRGPWLPAHNYLKNDVFSEDGSLYLVLVAHTSESEFDAGFSPSSGVDAYQLLLAPPEITQVMTLQITEDDLLNDVTQYLVAPTDGVVVGIDGVVQLDLTTHGILSVEISGTPVVGAEIAFDSGFLDAGSVRTADSSTVSATRNMSAGDVITVVPSEFSGLSGISGVTDLSGSTGAINVNVRWAQS